MSRSLGGWLIAGLVGCSATGGTTGAPGAEAAGAAGLSGGASVAGGSGDAGAAGSAGASGAAGAGGTAGASGAAGTSGASGTGGASGTSGTAGSSGTSGGAGASGTAGASGSAGAAGSSGSSGTGGAPSVRIVGRTAPGTNGALRFSWPGVNIHARFTGTQVAMDLNDGNNKNRFTVVVDGGTPKTITSPSGQASLPLASGLANGPHEIVIWRNTEASPGGITQFDGLSNFGAGGALLSASAAPDRRIEVIGDSLSVGAGVEGTSTSCTPSMDAFTNNYLAYGSVAARSVLADVVTIAWSGIGVYRSYDSTAPTMPARYDYAIPNDNTAWDFAKYQPHVVVVNLGTNDFGSGNPGQPYVDAYVAFVKHVRSKYASASFILIDMYGGERLTAINNVVSALKSGGESKVESLSFSSVPNNNTACNQHPNVTAQKAMGDILATRLKTLLGW